MGRMKIALCLPGGGVTGGMYQIGALSALEDALDGLAGRGFDLYIGTSSGATVAAALAGGLPVQRLYRALLDPADDYFPLERAHLTRMDLDEWRRTIVTAFGALRSGVSSLAARTPSPKDLWEQLDRFYDSLPAGLFTLDAFERFLEEFFLRRGLSNSFQGLAHPLRVVAHDLDSGDRVLFGAPGYDDVPLARACCASMALPLFYSPVRIRDRHYIDGGVGRVAHMDVAETEGADLIVSSTRWFRSVPNRVESPPVMVRGPAFATRASCGFTTRPCGWARTRACTIRSTVCRRSTVIPRGRT